MKFVLLTREVVPFFLALLALVAAALLADAALHAADAVWVGRYLGIAGALLIIGSFGYSLRKRKMISSGDPRALLRLHERMAWAGCLLVLVHAGVHFNAVLGWLAAGALLVNVGSGLAGKYLLQRVRLRLGEESAALRLQGLAGAALEERLYWDSLTVDVVKQWRVVHDPITLAFAVLATAHIAAVLVFWSWR